MIFTKLFDNHPDAVFIIDLNGKILHYNKSVKIIFGLTDGNIARDFEKYLLNEDIRVGNILILP